MTLTLGSIMIEQNWRVTNPPHHQPQKSSSNNNSPSNNCTTQDTNNYNSLSTNTNTNSTYDDAGSRNGCGQHYRGDHDRDRRCSTRPPANLPPAPNSIPVKLPAPTTGTVRSISSAAVSDISSLQIQEFLPICDALFNVISLGAYFCDIVFDILTAYTFYALGKPEWSILALTFIALSLISSQILSLRWYRGNEKRGQEPAPSSSFLVPVHLALAGVLWRYFKLFIPVDLRFIKSEVRDLCLLRLVHGFCEAAPMLLLQTYSICKKSAADQITDLDKVSTALSLFSVCWALASYSKNIRRQNVHKLVLTWLGVIFQFIWRLGTITARIVALAVYATMYHYWLFLVLFLHWVSMFLWLLSPKHVFDGEKLSKVKKFGYSAVIAVVYTFCYINVQQDSRPSRQKVGIFYVTMFLENSLLLSVWLIAARNEKFWFKDLSISLVFGAFLGGIAFMCLYYRYFHVRKLSYIVTANSGSSRASHLGNESNCSPTSQTSLPGKENNNHPPNSRGRPPILTNTAAGQGIPGKDKHGRPIGGPSALYNRINGHHLHHHQPNIPGVFNCRFNPAIKRKKKKPSSFVPDPVRARAPAPSTPTNHSTPNNEMMHHPFWKRPLSISLQSENEGSIISSRHVDIQQKLHEKKQKQLADLLEIEEEIKQGKLHRRPYIKQQQQHEFPATATTHDDDDNDNDRDDDEDPYDFDDIRQPIPFEKKQPWFTSDPPPHAKLSPRPPIIIPHSDPVSELMLDPNYLMYSPTGFYDQPEWNNYYEDEPEPLYQNENDEEFSAGGHLHHHHRHRNLDILRKSYRGIMSDDVESQLSIPRSYTLPREFKYKRKLRKIVKNEHFLQSTNSSDGDVDSAEDDPQHQQTHLNSTDPFPIPNPTVYHVHVSSSSAAATATATATTGQSRRYTGSRKQHRQPETKL